MVGDGGMGISCALRRLGVCVVIKEGRKVERETECASPWWRAA